MLTNKLIKFSILIVGIIFYLYYGIYKIIFVPFGLGGGDFMFIYRATQNFIDGRSIYFTAPNSGPYFYPPLSVLFFLPICLLKPHDAIVGWFILTHLIVVCSAYLIYRCGSHISRLNSLIAVIAAFGFSMPLFENIHTGNINILILLGLSLTYFLILSGRERIAPLALAVSSFLKIYPALLIAAFFHRKNWIFIKYFIVFSLILTLISLGIFGLSEHENFLKRLPDGYKYVGPSIYNASFTFIFKLLMNDQNRDVIIIINMIFGAILLLSWWYIANKKTHPLDDNAALCVDMFIISIITILVFPASNAMYQFICIIPFYFILFSRLSYSGHLKYINVFIILFFFISFWDIIICQLPLSRGGLTIKTIGQRHAEFPLLYPIFYSLPFLFNLSFFLWLLMNYNELRQALTFTFTGNSSNPK